MVFEGEGVVKDFPGNYTQYREWNSLKPAAEKEEPKKSVSKAETTVKKSYRNDNRRKMTYKEKREYEQLTHDIEALETEQAALEQALCSGTLSVEELTEKSKRLPQIKEELDEKGMRWLELGELE